MQSYPIKAIRIIAGSEALARKVRGYLDQREKIALSQWKKTILPTLKSVENDLLTRIKSYSLSEWDLINSKNILGQVQTIINNFGTQWTDAVLASQDPIATLGISSLNKEILLVNLTSPLSPVVTTDLLATLEPLTEVFTQIFTTDLSRIVKAEITTGLVNGESSSVVAKKIQDNFGNTSERIKKLTSQKVDLQKQYESGLINKSNYDIKISKINKQLEKGSKMSFARAETIARTEMNRAASFAREIRGREIQEYNPEARRIWVSLHKPNARSSHISVENITREKPIKLDEPFNVNGNKAMYPRDPALPAGESVNCGCLTVIVNSKDYSGLGTLSGKNLTPTRIQNES